MLYVQMHTVLRWVVIWVKGKCWVLFKRGFIGLICRRTLVNLLRSVYHVSRINLVPKSSMVYCSLWVILANLLNMLLWILLDLFLLQHVALTWFLLWLIGLVGYVLSHLWLVLLVLLMLLRSSLKIGYASMVCLQK